MKAIYVCGDNKCPKDSSFTHRFYFGCVPNDFSERTGRSKTNHQTLCTEHQKYEWDGGCSPHIRVDGEFVETT